MECLCPASTACAPLRPNRASPCAERAGASVRTARQSEDCLRVRPPRSATALRKGRSAVGGDAARGWHGRVGGSGTACHSATADSAFPRDAQSIRECALHGLVGIPPCALQRRLAASCASRRIIRSGPVVIAAHPARAIRRMSAQALPLAPLDLRHTCASLHIGTTGARPAERQSSVQRYLGLRFRPCSASASAERFAFATAVTSSSSFFFAQPSGRPDRKSCVSSLPGSVRM